MKRPHTAGLSQRDVIIMVVLVHVVTMGLLWALQGCGVESSRRNVTAADATGSPETEEPVFRYAYPPEPSASMDDHLLAPRQWAEAVVEAHYGYQDEPLVPSGSQPEIVQLTYGTFAAPSGGVHDVVIIVHNPPYILGRAGLEEQLVDVFAINDGTSTNVFHWECVPYDGELEVGLVDLRDTHLAVYHTVGRGQFLTLLLYRWCPASNTLTNVFELEDMAGSIALPGPRQVAFKQDGVLYEIEQLADGSYDIYPSAAAPLPFTTDDSTCHVLDLLEETWDGGDIQYPIRIEAGEFWARKSLPIPLRLTDWIVIKSSPLVPPETPTELPDLRGAYGDAFLFAGPVERHRKLTDRLVPTGTGTVQIAYEAYDPTDGTRILNIEVFDDDGGAE